MQDGHTLKQHLEDQDITKARFARKLDITPQALQSIFKTKTIGNDMKDKIVEILGKDIFKSDILKEPENSYIKKEQSEILTELDYNTFTLISVVNKLAYASYSQNWDDENFISELQKIPVNVPKDGIYRAFEVSGDSMTDGTERSINEGDIVICRKLYKEHWKHRFHLKKYQEWIIVHSENGIMLKSISHQNLNNGDILCTSYNPTENDFKLNLDHVQELYYVKQVIKSR